MYGMVQYQNNEVSKLIYVKISTSAFYILRKVDILYAFVFQAELFKKLVLLSTLEVSNVGFHRKILLLLTFSYRSSAGLLS